MADFYKTFGQNMQRKATNKLLVRKCHLFLKSVLTVIFVAKSYVLIVNTLDAVIANGYFMSISSQIFHH